MIGGLVLGLWAIDLFCEIILQQSMERPVKAK
jgi:hypothetical protein